MSLKKEFDKLAELCACFAREPRLSFRLIGQLPRIIQGYSYARNPAPPPDRQGSAAPPAGASPLEVFFNERQTGRGIWKWMHYFDIYHRHLAKFVGREMSLLEIGVYSGGSLEMWRRYFGERCRVHGVDLHEACRSYENEYTRIFVGDQADPGFWRSFVREVPCVDVLIDDGGHQVKQQIATLEAMLPRIRPGGVYLCEDIHGIHNGFAAYLQGFVKDLNAMQPGAPGGGVAPSPLQRWIGSVHLYPYVAVVERSAAPVDSFSAPKRGTEWAPFNPGAAARAPKAARY
jgi:hypothetical protein